MPITRTQGTAFPHIYLPNNTQKQSACNVIALLQYAGIWRAAGQRRTTVSCVSICRGIFRVPFRNGF
jgi:hypothetical protein